MTENNKWDDSNKFWEESGKSFALDDSSYRHNFDAIAKCSARSKGAATKSHMPMKSLPVHDTMPFSIKSDEELKVPEFFCSWCNREIYDGDIVYEGQYAFHAKDCWNKWIDDIALTVKNEIHSLVSIASKRALLNRVCANGNGRLITKAVIELKKGIDENQFNNLITENKVAFQHYMSFLKESNQYAPNLLRLKDPMEEIMTKFQNIVMEYITSSNNSKFICALSEFRDEISTTYNLTLFFELIQEYMRLLEFQDKMGCGKLSLISTIHENIAYQAFMENNIERLKEFKLLPEEFFWLLVKPMVKNGNIDYIDKALNFKGFGSKPDVEMGRVVTYLVSLELSEENDIPKELLHEAKMKCLSRISNISELVETANLYKLTEKYIEYLKQRKESKQLKKVMDHLKPKK